MVAPLHLLCNFSPVALSNPGLGKGVEIDKKMTEMKDLSSI